MPMQTYNLVMLAAWLLVSIGAGLVYLPAGLIVAGLGLVAALLLTLQLARRGMLQASPPPKGAAAQPAQDAA